MSENEKYYLNKYIVLFFQIKSRICELVENLEESDHLMMRAEKELISLKQLKDDKTVELQQVSSKFACLFPIRKK
jgi:hypothetical protein